MKIKACISLFVLIFAFTTYPQASRVIEKTDSLRSRVSKFEGKQKLSAYLDLIEYLVLNQPDKVLLEKENILTLVDELDDKKSLVKIYLLLGESYFKTSQRNISPDYFNKALELAKEIADSSQIAEAMIKLGRLNITFGYLDESLKNFEDAMNISEKSKSIKTKIMAICYLGILNYILGNIKAAEEFSFNSLEMSKKINYQEGIRLASEHLSIVRIEQKKYKEALEYNSRAYKITLERDFVTNIPAIYYNYAVIYRNMEDYDKAIDYLKKSQTIRQSYGDKLGSASDLSQLGRIYLSKKEYQIAIDYFTKAYDVSKNFKALRNLASNARWLAIAYENIGDYKTALRYFKEFNTFSDSLKNENVKRETAKLTAKKLLEEKEKEVLYLKETADFQRQIQKFLIIVSTIILFLLISSIFLYLKVRKSKQHLSEMNQKLIYLDNERSKFFSIITHDLKSPFLGIMGLTELLKEEIKSSNNPVTISLIDKLDIAIKNQFKLVDNLLTWIRIQSGKMKYESSEFSLSEVLTNAIDNLKYFSIQKRIDIKTDVEKEFTLNTDRNMILSILMNLLSNSIKFSHPDSEVNIIVSQKKAGFVSIQIKDKGIGIPQEKISELFNLGYSTNGTENEKGTGFGLHIVKEMLERNNGEISVISEENVGSTFEISLPFVSK